VPVRRKLNRWLPAVVAVAAFIVALVAWTLNGRVSPDHVNAGPDSAVPSVSGAPSSTASSPAPATSSGSRSPGTDAGGFPTNLPLNGSNVVDVHSGAPHRVTIEATSDSSILRLLFYVRGGSPSSGRYTGVASPVRISTIGHEGTSGPIAEIWMQSSLYAHTITCTITVDGYVRSTQSARGPHNVAVCIA
jgi:hypothetical protein